jgi:hypothetical protein
MALGKNDWRNSHSAWKGMGSVHESTAIPRENQSTPFPSHPLSMLSGFSSTTQNSTLYSFREEFRGTAALTYSFCHRVRPNEPSGEYTAMQLKKKAQYIRLHTPLSAIFGEHWCPPLWWWSQGLTFVGNVSKTVLGLSVLPTVHTRWN